MVSWLSAVWVRTISDFLVCLLQIAMTSHDAFPKSVVLHFPPDVYQNTGATQMLPQLLQILKPDELRCVQFLRGGKVRVSFKDKAVRCLLYTSDAADE